MIPQNSTKLPSVDATNPSGTGSRDKAVPILRVYPSPAISDTVLFDEDLATSTHIRDNEPPIKSFPDENILGVIANPHPEHPPSTQLFIDMNSPVRHVFLQRGIRACMQACVEMLLADKLGGGDYRTILDREVQNLVNSSYIMTRINNSGYKPVKTEKVTIQHLKTLIDTNGSAITLIVKSGIGAHAIIVDKLENLDDENGWVATVRDPYHGWCVEIKNFEQFWGGESEIYYNEVLQIENNRVDFSKSVNYQCPANQKYKTANQLFEVGGHTSIPKGQARVESYG